jgi:polar amino acid transport system substrate-binding protein
MVAEFLKRQMIICACQGKREDWKMKMKKLLALLLACMMAFSLAACGGKDNAKEETKKEDASDWAAIKKSGKLKIGITIYEPMNYKDKDGKLIGFDTEYAEAVCEKLGVEPEFIEINWETKETELESGNIDCIWNGFTIRDDLKEQITFTDPYIKNKQVVVIQKENADKYKDAKSLDGATVSAEKGSAGEKAVTDGKPLGDVECVAVSKQTDALTEVKAGTSQAAVLDYTLASSMVGEGTDYEDLMMIDGLELAVEEYGIGCRLDSDLAKQINDKTAELVKDGTLNKLAKKYDLAASLISNQE